jgi:hypothetical protein
VSLVADVKLPRRATLHCQSDFAVTTCAKVTCNPTIVAPCNVRSFGRRFATVTDDIEFGRPDLHHHRCHLLLPPPLMTSKPVREHAAAEASVYSADAAAEGDLHGPAGGAYRFHQLRFASTLRRSPFVDRGR